MPGNVIGSCIINILSHMKYANKRKIESLILLIDFRKAFDSLSHKYIDKCLKMFNFGPSIRKWVSLFFSNREAYILLGGELGSRRNRKIRPDTGYIENPAPVEPEPEWCF